MTTTERLAEALRALLADKYLADPINAERMAPARAALAEYDGIRAMDANWRLWQVTVVYRGSLYRNMSVRAVDAVAAVEKARDYFKHERLPALAKWTATELPG